MPNIEMTITLAVLAAAILMIAAMVILEKRPRIDLTPRLLPTTPIMLAAGLVAMLAVVHVVNLLGYHTGR